MNRFVSRVPNRLVKNVLLAVVLGATLAACAPLLVGSAITSAVVATDRRTAGAQLEDQGIELRAANRLKDQMGTRARIAVTSFNRRALLTGEVANENDKRLAEDITKGVDNVVSVFNELGITNSPSFGDKAADGLLTGRVKASMVDSKDIAANSFKVVTNRGTVYLMGLVTKAEADRATDIARNMTNVKRVVRVMEIVAPDGLYPAPVSPAPVSAPAGTPAKQ